MSKKKECSSKRGTICTEEWTPHNIGKLVPTTINILVIKLFKHTEFWEKNSLEIGKPFYF